MWHGKFLSGRKFSFLLILSLCILVLTEETAEARRGRFFRRRGPAFGRRFRPAPRRRMVRVNRGVNRGFNRGFNNLNGFDRLALAREAVDPFSSLALDPSGDLSRLAGLSGLGSQGGLRRIGTSNILVNAQGQFFETGDTEELSTDRPLVFNDGKILGGAIVPLRNDTLEQVRQLNAIGAFRGFGRRRF